MGKTGTATVTWRENRGRNGWDVPSRLLPGQVAECFDMSLERGVLGRKRYGSNDVTIGGDTFSGIRQLARHVPGQNDAAAEVFIVSNDGTTKILRVAAGTSAANLTLTDNVATRPQDVHMVTGNGKLFFFYDSTVNRGHVFDPATSTTAIRRMGIELPSAPTAANTGVGSYPATLRYYRVQWVIQVSSANYLFSNLGPALSFTPSGTGTGVNVSRPSSSGADAITHWRLFVSTDDQVYYQLSGTLAVGTGSYTDSTATADYPAGTLAPEEGAYTPFPSCKFGLWTGDRLLGFGVYETAAGDSHVPKAGTVYFSPVLDTTSVNYADDERCSNTVSLKGTITVSRNSGSEDRAIAGPLYDEVFVFQSKGIYALTPTGQPQKPYLRSVISPSVGAVSQWSTVMGEDEFGRPCIYFLDPARGPYRYGASGLQWLGMDVQDLWASFNPAAANRTAEGVYYAEERRVVWRFASGSSDDATTEIVFEIHEGEVTREGVRYGWTRNTVAATPKCLAMLPSTIAATMSRKLLPYSGYTTGNVLVKHDDSSAQDDDGTAYQGYVTSPIFDASRPQYAKSSSHAEAWLMAKAASGVTLQVSVARNYGDVPARTQTVSLSPAQATQQTRVTRRIEASELADVSVFQVTIGDVSALATAAWVIDEYGIDLNVTDQFVGNT